MDTEEKAIAVKRDLDQMKPKVLSQVEQEIVEGKPSLIEQALHTKTKSPERSHSSELDRAFLSCPASQLVIEASHQGCSLHQAAEIASVSVSIARKVLAVLQKH